jgi:enoyl-CoA hydratase
MIESTQRDDGVAVVTLAYGKANLMDTEFCTALAEGFEAYAAKPPSALVVTGQGRIFSAGVGTFLPSLDRMLLALLGVPCPVVAAINGHAIAGGCLLAAAADRRLMARGSGRIGMPELRVGVPFPPVALELARSVLRPDALQRALAGGETFDVDTAQAVGLVDDSVDAEQLLEHATALAVDLAGISAPTYALTKAMLQQPMRARIADQAEAHAGQVDALWQDAATFDAVRAFVARTMGKG